MMKMMRLLLILLKSGDNEYEVSGELSISDMLENLDMPEDKIECSGNSVGGLDHGASGTCGSRKRNGSERYI